MKTPLELTTGSSPKSVKKWLLESGENGMGDYARDAPDRPKGWLFVAIGGYDEQDSKEFIDVS